MYFPFRDHIKIEKDQTGSVTTTYTLTHRALVVFEDRSPTFGGSLSNADIIADNIESAKPLAIFKNRNDPSDYASNPVVLATGTIVEFKTTFGGILRGTFHIFEMP
jgi:hypothetical protein